MADVFLSYARADARTAERVAREITKAGKTVWFDRELPAHRPYSEVIASELETAAAVVVLWSNSSAASEWVRSEANRARELHKLVQARVDDVRLPMPFDQIQCADLRKWRAGGAHLGWTQLLKSVDALLGAERAPGHLLPDATVSRRSILIGGAVAAAASVSVAGWKVLTRKSGHSSPEAALLLQKGVDTLQSDDVFKATNPGSLRNAVALLTEATDADPQSSEAWGSLALAYAGLKRVSPISQKPGLVLRSQSAAAKAFQIDAHEPRATGALLLLKPVYRHWVDVERSDREALKSTPQRVPLLIFIMSDMLRSVGRCKEAAAVSGTFDRKAFIIPGADEQVLLDFWSAGDLEAADGALALAIQHWPQHPQVWRTRVTYLMYSGRASEALALLRDETQWPPGTPNDLIITMQSTAGALGGQTDSREAVSRNLSYLKSQPTAAFDVAHACAMLGDTPTALSILDGYYFNEGAWARVAPAAGDEDRQTEALFQPPMRALWPQPHFSQLLRRTGLEFYWHKTGVAPDFRRAI